MNGIFELIFGTLLSGTIAILGNTLGRYIGRKKLSIFNLRPRHTSTLITVFTGGLIFAVTVLVLVALSQPIRVQLFDQQKLRQDVEDARSQRDAMQQDLASKQQELKTVQERLDKLNQDMWKFKSNTPMYLTNEVVYLRLVDCDVPPELIEEQIDSLLAEANRIVIARKNDYTKPYGVKPIPEDTKVVAISGGLPIKKSLLDQLGSLHEKRLVLLRAWSNEWYMDENFPMIFEVRPLLLCFKKDEVIAETPFKGAESRVAVVEHMQDFLKIDAKKKIGLAKARGLVQDELIFDMPLSTLVEAQDKIVATRKPVVLKLVAAHDIYNFQVGHLDCRLEVK